MSIFSCSSLNTNKQYIKGLVQDCSNSIANTLELLQSCTEPLIYSSGNLTYHVLLLIIVMGGGY